MGLMSKLLTLKILGVIIDNQLNFTEQCLNIKTLMNRKSSIQRRVSFFNLCLFKLFKLKPNQDHKMDKFSGTLQKYG